LKSDFDNAAPQLYVRSNEDSFALADRETILDAARTTIENQFKSGALVNSPTQAKDFIQLQLASYQHEMFAVLWLTTKHTVIEFEELFRGTLDKASVYPREIVKSALQHNAGACILCHNHPSGNSEPSHADRSITESIKLALELVDVRTLDHFIVGENICSFAERGIL